MNALIFRIFVYFILFSCSWLRPPEGFCQFAQAAESELKPALTERQHERRLMVETQLSGPGRMKINDEVVVEALLKVPRHVFIPENNRSLAYIDGPVPIGYGQTISQPYIVALMTQALEVKPGMKILEVGTGSGYQAAILAEITPLVYTIEIIRPLYQSATDRLKDLGYTTVRTFQGDGYFGWPENGPFDRIIVTCAALHIPPPLFEQLATSGKMVIPVGGNFETQRLLLVTKEADGRRRSETLTLVRFVPLIREGLEDWSTMRKTGPFQP